MSDAEKASTPTTEDVRRLWVMGSREFDVPVPTPEESLAEFDRWLARHDEETRTAARDEAAQRIRDYWDAVDELVDNHNSAKLAFDRVAQLVTEEWTGV